MQLLSLQPEFLALLAFATGLLVASLAAMMLGLRGRKHLRAIHIQMQESLNAKDIQLTERETRLEGLEAQIGALKLELADHQQRVQTLQDEKYQALQQGKVLEARLSERERGFQQQLEQFEQQKQSLKKEFELLANKIFEEKGRNFSNANRSEMQTVLKPFREQIDQFQRRVNDVHKESVQGNTKLEAQIKHVLDIGNQMSVEANALVSALKGDKKAQGSWSEIQAELLLEMSGLQEGREYKREASLKSEDGRDQRPDFIVILPGDKHVIIDSKISLVAYAEAMTAETEDQRQLCLKKHVDALRHHVRSLSDKNYARLKGVNSPEYVFMFIGNEPAYLAAAEYDPSLFQEAYRKGVAIVTSNTLLASLRIVAHLWSIDKQNSHTRQLAEQASKVYDKLRIFVEKMERMGAQLNTVQKTYDDTWTSLKDGRGSLVKQVDKFVDMGVTVKEKLPSSVTGEDGPDEP